MRGLIKKLFTPLAVAGVMALPLSTNAQQNGKDEFKQKNYLSIGVGGYQGNAKSMQDIYGTIPRIRGVFEKEMSKNFTLGGAIAYLRKEGTPYIFTFGDVEDVNGSTEVQMLQLEGLAKYVFGKKGVRFYLGGGLTLIKFNEKLTLSGSFEGDYITKSAEANKTAIGPILILGLNIPINKDETTFIYGEASGSSVNINSDLGTKVDIGGGVFEVGVKFTIN